MNTSESKLDKLNKAQQYETCAKLCIYKQSVKEHQQHKFDFQKSKHIYIYIYITDANESKFETRQQKLDFQK